MRTQACAIQCMKFKGLLYEICLYPFGKSDRITKKRFAPFVLRFEEPFDDFARRAAPADFFRYVMSAFADLFNRVRDGDGQSHAAHYWQVGQVVANVSDLLAGEAFGCSDLFVNGEFVVNALMQVVDLQVSGA